MEKGALQLDLLLGAFLELETILTAKIEVRFSANIAARGRAWPKLLKMHELTDNPTRSLS